MCQLIGACQSCTTKGVNIYVYAYTMAKYPVMDWVGENIAERFKMFKQRMSLILLDENIVDPAKQASSHLLTYPPLHFLVCRLGS